MLNINTSGSASRTGDYGTSGTGETSGTSGTGGTGETSGTGGRCENVNIVGRRGNPK